ncbi:ORF6N domain-containing protein [Bacteroidota bacterium]
MKEMKKTVSILKETNIVNYIHIVRGIKIILDYDLALLYHVETKVLKQQVRRNIRRFPVDFMFELKIDEYSSLRSQIVTLKRGQHSKYPPFAFTEQGVAMLSGILRSDLAIDVNIAIMRTFVQLREIMNNHKELETKIENLEKNYDEKFSVVFRTIKQIIQHKSEPRKKIGFKIE